LNAIPDLMFRINRQGVFLSYNVDTNGQLSVPSEKFLKKNIYEFLPGELADLTMTHLRRTLDTGTSQVFEYKLAVPIESTNIRFYECRMVVTGHDEVLAIIRDVTDRIHAEQKLKNSLEEKKILLKEIHHRVKNNLQIISSLLHLQSRRLKDGNALEKFTECQSRIQSMALIHTQLYQSGDFRKLDFGEYLTSLITYLFRMYGADNENISLKKNINKVYLDLDYAIPCGLIFNELISNALKHAFPQSKKGEITIGIRRHDNNLYCLSVSDNGVGFPEDLDFREADTLGLILIHSLVDQLEGSLEVEITKGVTVTITFAV